jgi:hypothetical protein
VNDLWSWQQNLSDGLSQLNSKQSGAYTFWSNQVNQWNQWNATHPTQKVGGASNNAGGPCVFNFPDVQGTYDFKAAEWIKAYNGAAVYYISLIFPQGAPPYWKIDDTPNNYVEHVCQAPLR